jgi:hypothetical protein
MSTGRQGPFVQRRAVLVRRRVLAVTGEVLCGVGDRVDGGTVVARAVGRGCMHTVNAAGALDLPPADLPRALRCAVGDLVEAGQVLARTRGLFGLLSSTCHAPVAGRVAAISPHTGRILLEEPGADQEVRAFLPGLVTESIAGRGVAVSAWAARAAGVFGVGGECSGPLRAAVGRPDAVLEVAAIDPSMAGSVLVGGALVTGPALARAAAVGVAGIITGGVHDRDLAEWLGAEVMLADSTVLPAPLTLVVVGGFGRIALEATVAALLGDHLGRLACLSGHTRVRAGALRPEVIIPLEGGADSLAADAQVPALAVGSTVLVVRAPWFGERGRVAALPADPRAVECGAACQVAEVDLEAGATVIVPCANLEVLAGPEPQEGAS